MDPDGDISDTFDDDDWAKSIESGKEGPWSDESAVFEDPKLAHLKKAISTPQQTDYQQRRMRELQARTGKGKAAQPTNAPPPAPAPAPDADADVLWGEATPEWNDLGTVAKGGEQTGWQDRRSSDMVPDPDSPSSVIVHARRATDRTEPEEEEEVEEEQPNAIATSLLVSYAPSVLAATVVFVATTIVHGSMVGWQIDLLFRGTAAMLITGVLWRRFQAGRLRAMAIAAITYAALFVPSDRLGEPENVFAVFLGLLITIAGAGMIGVQRDELGA